MLYVSYEVATLHTSLWTRQQALTSGCTLPKSEVAVAEEGGVGGGDDRSRLQHINGALYFHGRWMFLKDTKIFWRSCDVGVGRMCGSGAEGIMSKHQPANKGVTIKPKTAELPCRLFLNSRI